MCSHDKKMVDILFQEVYALTEPIILYVNYIPITMCIFFGFFFAVFVIENYEY